VGGQSKGLDAGGLLILRQGGPGQAVLGMTGPGARPLDRVDLIRSRQLGGHGNRISETRLNQLAALRLMLATASNCMLTPALAGGSM
jgi:hypothetical protein